MILKASVTFSFVALPPTSKKFAGEAPLSLIISIVAMARPAPLTKHPIVPSSFIYAKSNLLANISAGSSSVSSLNDIISGCLNKALLSKDIFASRAIKLYSEVNTRGLISNKLASFSIKSLYNWLKNLPACLKLEPFNLSSLAINLEWKGWKPIVGSILKDKIFSGVSLATFSMSIPPSVDAIIDTLLVTRSITIEK